MTRPRPNQVSRLSGHLPPALLASGHILQLAVNLVDRQPTQLSVAYHASCGRSSDSLLEEDRFDVRYDFTLVNDGLRTVRRIRSTSFLNSVQIGADDETLTGVLHKM